MKQLYSMGTAIVFVLSLGRANAQGVSPATNPSEWVRQVQAQIAATESNATAPAAYEPAAKAMALLCQSDPFFFRDEPPLRPAWTPPEILKLNPSWVDISPDEARVEFGGGFHHFGYHLKRDISADNEKQNGWILEFYSEDSPSKPLKSFTLDKGDHVEQAQFIQGALSEFERRAGMRPDSDRDIVERLGFLLKFNDVETARSSIRKCAAANPQDWADQLLAYIIDAKTDPTASTRLEAWARQQGDFSAWLLAAYAYDVAGDESSAERCTHRALVHAVDNPEWSGYNARYRGAGMCAQLLKEARYTTCAALCDALLSYSDSGTYLASQIASIRDLARHATPAQSPPAPPVFEEGEIFAPLKAIDISRLVVSNTTPSVSPAPTQVAGSVTDPKQARLIEYFDHRIAADPGSTRNYTEKITYLLSINRNADALAACKIAAQALPKWWRPQMGLVVLADADSRKRAEPPFRKWVEDNPAFIHWWYLSHLYRESGRDGDAVAALQSAVKYPLENVDEDETRVPAAFAYDAASYAYQHKQFALVLDIARVWSSPRGVYNYFDDDIYAFRAAAELALGEFDAAKTDADKVVKAASEHAIWAGHLSELQQAVTARNREFVYDPGSSCGGDWVLFPAP